ncbi:MAG: four helix bundle protein [Acidobacteriota bacterium]
MVTRPPAQSFEDLLVWQKSHALVLCVYKMTKSYPREELFGLVSQMRRAAVSVPANIAEAFKRKSRVDKARVVNLAQTSLEELRYYLVLSSDLGYVRLSNEHAQVEEIARMLGAYARTLLTPDS